MDLLKIFYWLLLNIPAAVLGMYIFTPAILLNAFVVACLFLLVKNTIRRVAVLLLDGVIVLQSLVIVFQWHGNGVRSWFPLLAVFPTALAFWLSRKYLIQGNDLPKIIRE